MKMKLPKHNVDTIFILVLFAVFAVAVVAVLALGANSYKNLVGRDGLVYNRRIITSYITAKIRSNDEEGTIETGGFAKPGQPDGVDTLHLFRDIEGEKFDLRIYYYDGYICELFTLAGNEIKPEAGNRIMEAGALHFTQSGNRIQIYSEDADGNENTAAVSLRSGRGVAA